ncbi:hypothetical protein BU14_0231s0025 [Porphyra umbilicalis]|uniref:Uncharacterized protein n=1 Tax=Porphyra umbilicalis TaxID=2786 RepID=A0A1X6P3X1_PORUM|nr:hypothetical protein BU14_0231s0025 [Porphyra umbilicalis]|eukprot:OSX75572.1 hypothetical protein BU14_0231s0025 [Porphyra umbilicalis]
MRQARRARRRGEGPLDAGGRPAAPPPRVGARHALEHWLTGRNAGLLPVLRVLYRELLILGVVSLIFVLFVTFGDLSAQATVSFEFAHLVLFALAVFYTVTLLVTSYASVVLSRRWQRIEALPLDTYLAYKAEYGALRAVRDRHRSALWRKGLWSKGNLLALARWEHLHETLAFHDVRFQFLFYRDLPAHFPFAAFLNRVKTALFTSLVEVPATSWALILPIIVLDMARREWVVPQEGIIIDRYVLLGLAVLVTVLVDVLGWKIGRINWQLFRHPATYFNDLRGVFPTGASVGGSIYDSDDGSRAAMELDDPPAPEPGGDAARSAKPAKGDLPTASADGGGAVAVDMDAAAASSDATTTDPDAPTPAGGGDFVDSLFTGGDDEAARRQSVGARRHSIDAAVRTSLDGRASIDGGRRRSTDGRRASLGAPTGGGRAPTGGRRSTAGGRHHPAAATAARRATARRRRMRARLQTRIQPPTAGGGGGGGGGGGARRRHSVDRRSGPGARRLAAAAAGRRSSAAAASAAAASGRASVELAGHLPIAELRTRHLLSTGGAGGAATFAGRPPADGRASGSDGASAGRLRSGSSGGGSVGRGSGSSGSTLRAVDGVDGGGGGAGGTRGSGALKKIDSAIVQRHAANAVAAETAPMMRRSYPPWVLWVAPRLGRVASPSEKLFWVGSHRWCLWLLQTNLFAATLLAAIMVAAYATAAVTGTLDARPVDTVVIVVVSVMFLYVLHHTARAMRAYPFVLNSTGLVEERLALSLIDRVQGAKTLQFRYDIDGGTAWDGWGSDGSGARGRGGSVPPPPPPPASADVSSGGWAGLPARRTAAVGGGATPSPAPSITHTVSGGGTWGATTTAVGGPGGALRSAGPSYRGDLVTPRPAPPPPPPPVVAAVAADRARRAPMWQLMSGDAGALLEDEPGAGSGAAGAGGGGGGDPPTPLRGASNAAAPPRGGRRPRRGGGGRGGRRCGRICIEAGGGGGGGTGGGGPPRTGVVAEGRRRAVSAATTCPATGRGLAACRLIKN